MSQAQNKHMAHSYPYVPWTAHHCVLGALCMACETYVLRVVDCSASGVRLTGICTGDARHSTVTSPTVTLDPRRNWYRLGLKRMAWCWGLV